MGNQLVGIAPSEIFPVEHYLTDHTQLQFDASLGSTRFFKVARAKSQEGMIVVKVFAVHDPMLPLVKHRVRVEEIKTKLQSAVNCLCFQKVIMSDKAVFLMREYVKYSLYDRISTRPFLTITEKKFIAFQILFALRQCHTLGVSHGDIKLENIMITSWNWVLLTDIASYKPTYLPDDNPADYSFFFDTSRRRLCYIAPERFVKSSTEANNQLLPSEDHIKKGELTPAMDIFSAGCSIAEMFTDGHPLFDLSQLLAYRNGEYDPNPHIESIEDQGIKDLIKSMIQLNPADRCSAELYLDEEKNKIFPDYFYSFLQPYLQMFSATDPIISPDEKIDRLKSDIKGIINMLLPSNDSTECTEGLVLIVQLVTSCIRGLHLSTTKVQALDVLLELSRYCSAETVLDRIVPYIFHMIQDVCPGVRKSALHALNNMLSTVNNLKPSDANTFPEYIFPGLINVAHDDAVIVRTTFAQIISQLAQTGLRFLKCCQKVKDDEPTTSAFETELATLHEMVQQSVSVLLTDSHNIVKQTLVNSNIVELCEFFGTQRANDVILSHMVTFLNDKTDKHLRASFFENFVNVASFVGPQCSPILSPLLQQGFSDSEEFVAKKALNAMTLLIEKGLLQKTALCHLISDISCFLIHPNLWIRQATVGCFSTTARILDDVDVQCKILPVMKPYLKHSMILVDREELVLNTLKEPLPRNVYDTVVKCSIVDTFVKILGERKKARTIANTGHIPLPSVTQSMHQNSALRNLIRKLESEGMTEEVEDQLFALSVHILKVHRQLAFDNKYGSKGKIKIGNSKNNVNCHSVSLMQSQNSKLQESSATNRRKCVDDQPVANMNDEWKCMFGGQESSKQMTHSSQNPSPVGGSYTFDVQPSPSHSIEGPNDMSYIHYRYAPCRLELGKLISHRQECYEMTMRRHEWAEQEVWKPRLPPPGWRLRSQLVAHLHEHKAAVNRLVSIPNTSLFASCSSDSYVRIWDCVKMEGKNIANRSKQVYNHQNGALYGMTTCRNNQSLATVSHSGSVVVLNIDSNSTKLPVIQSKQLDLHEDGCAIDVSYLDSGSQMVLVYATVYGSLVGWDLRAPKLAWKVNNDIKQGIITAMCLDTRQSCLTLGTSSGYHTCWDLRFRLPIATIAHSKAVRVRRLIRHPTESSWIISAMQDNNEVTVWNLESGSKQQTLWASSAPPLSNSQTNNHSVCALYTMNTDHGPELLTGGTDQRIRKWNLTSPGDSYIAIPAASDVMGHSLYCYECRLVDGTNVVQEVCTKSSSAVITGDEEPPCATDQPAPGHVGSILDITSCMASQCFLVSASCDGIIKVWK
ncbi:phosphoinositide 3-kinase regulatory subunit 4 [Adelges cooleyi]|uniref:phosphoinositide 3-kinase regulatory subunit 4 n=1 Tax=Adelges cooleyi TaxID=133065 RepID=UPI00217FD524|nr:phosphoinositide 3-kinase regulatory subunit 4 [Adelges cooleyi]XP_050436052.1 phosphoinositide 3-kinase regulatory subunit 4 [Adelges cooleyi]